MVSFVYLSFKFTKQTKMKTTRIFMAIAIIAATFSACSKGDTGATGPQGPAGTNGVTNISSNIYSITPGSWSNPKTGQYVVNIADNAISNANTDGIEVFISTGGNTWLGLPVTNLLVNGDQMEYVYENGQIVLGYFNSSAPSNTIDLKVVVIPPAQLNLHPNTNWNDYSQVNAIMQAETIHAN
jgi:hypothetical protein